MTTELSKIPIIPKTGEERLKFKGRNLDLKLIDFWQWSASNLLGNTDRGILAEFIVAAALDIDLKVHRNDWDAWDLTSNEKIKIEVKSSAFIQTWYQKDFSKISFSIKAKRNYDSSTNLLSLTPQRLSDVYVFCLLHHKDQATIDPLNLDQWEFYVVSTDTINNYKRSDSSITLNSLQKLTKAVSYDQLGKSINSYKNDQSK